MDLPRRKGENGSLAANPLAAGRPEAKQSLLDHPDGPGVVEVWGEAHREMIRPQGIETPARQVNTRDNCGRFQARRICQKRGE